MITMSEEELLGTYYTSDNGKDRIWGKALALMKEKQDEKIIQGTH